MSDLDINIFDGVNINVGNNDIQYNFELLDNGVFDKKNENSILSNEDIEHLLNDFV